MSPEDDKSVVENSTEPVPPRAGGAARSRRTWWIAAFSTAAVVLAGAVVSFAGWGSGVDGPDSVVAAYLAAVRAGNTDKALKIAQTAVSSDDGSDGFVEPAVVSDEWEVESVTLRAQSTRDAIVDVTTSGPDGTKDGVFLLHRVPGEEWNISNPFVTLMISQVPIWSQSVEPGAEPQQELVINGKSVTYPVPEPEKVGVARHLLLFPGFYRFYPEDDDLFSPIAEPATWLPTGEQSVVADRLLMRLTSDTRQAAEDAVNGLLKDCAAATETQPKNCPFGAEYVKTSDGSRNVGGSEVSWELPEPADLYFADSGLGYFQPVDRGRTTVTLQLSEKDGGGAVDCGIAFDALRVGVTRKGEVSLLPNNSHTNHVPMDTC